MKWPLSCLAILLLTTSLSAAGAGDSDDPNPAAGDVTVPLPNSREMVFRPVYLGVSGDQLWATREFTMGDGTVGEFSETPTRVSIGGSFQGTNTSGRPDWYYLIGKYDVTVSQYDAVMGTTSPGSPNQPITKLTLAEIYTFLEKLNESLYASKAALPQQDGASGFCRLPTEGEWEFAARGGTAVSDSVFDQSRPYSGDLVHYEWFSGPRSSGDHIEDVGLLHPGPLGLYDMLGDVRQLVSPAFQVEYVQGRAGGLTTRGGDFRTPEAEIRSSARTEQALYGPDLAPARPDNVGFRLVLGSNLFPNLQTYRKLEKAWPNYVKIRRAPTPENQNFASAQTSTSVQLTEISNVLDQLEKSLPSDSGAAALQQIAIIRASFDNIQSAINKSGEVLAKGGVRLASLSATRIMESSQRIAVFQNLLASTSQVTDPEDYAKIQTKLDNEKENLDNSEQRYIESFNYMAEADQTVVVKEFTEWISNLQLQDIPQQAAATTVALRHYQQFMRNKRTNMDAWVIDLAGTK